MANSKSIAAAGNAESDVHTMQVDSVSAVLIIKADNDGTPASDDTLTCKLLETVGDTDTEADTVDDYTTVDNAVPVAVLDTNSNDPSTSQAISLPGEIKALKIRADNDSAGRAITVSSQIVELDKDGTKLKTQITWT